MAKSLGAGMPLSSMVGRAVLTDAAEPGGLGGIYADHSLACTAAHAVLEVIVEENLSTRADTLGRQLKKRLEHGLLLLVCSVHGNVIRFLFPLTIEPAVLDEGLDILEHALTHGAVAQA
nr:gamma-aminobutyrate:alpha-ketoglutarate aminotransferase [Mycetohabitans endofungorum]